MSKLFDTPNSLPMAIEYIGSKRLLLDFVVGNIVRSIGNVPHEIADVFSGTGVVSAAFKASGFSVSANDHLSICFNLTAAVLLNDRAPSFSGLPTEITNKSESPYLSVLQFLNNCQVKEDGFVYKNYSPASLDMVGFERRYFTEANAARIDTIRNYIEEWDELLSLQEKSLLLSDLVRAVSIVSNVAGTYGCYLKKWKNRALEAIILRQSAFVIGRNEGHTVTSIDAHQALKNKSTPIVYADPPYTKRQYAAYYHVLETIVRNDRPAISGSTGLRNWATHSSDFCYKRKAEGALENLVKASDCSDFFLSYNEDGQISHNRILDLLNDYGEASFSELNLKRYKSSNLPHKGPTVAERLYHLRFK
jgi:adenine-specific DNA-methyltransferase